MRDIVVEYYTQKLIFKSPNSIAVVKAGPQGPPGADGAAGSAAEIAAGIAAHNTALDAHANLIVRSSRDFAADLQTGLI